VGKKPTFVHSFRTYYLVKQSLVKSQVTPDTDQSIIDRWILDERELERSNVLLH
jgi:hypothetical protein